MVKGSEIALEHHHSAGLIGLLYWIMFPSHRPCPTRDEGLDGKRTAFPGERDLVPTGHPS